MKKISLIFLLALICFSCSNEKKRYVIGVSQCSEDIWRNKLNTELKMSGYHYDNVELKFASANDNDKLQIEQINKFVNDGVDLLIISPNQVNTISSAINRAYDHGVKIILFDRKTDSHKYTAFIGADNFEVGKTMGCFIAKRLNGKGNVVEIEGLKGSSPAIERHNGFISALKEYPGIKLVGRRSGDWTEESGHNAMDSILAKTIDIDCVFGQNDRMTLGARQSVIKHHITRPIFYVGIDALATPDGGIRSVSKGIMAASYIYPTSGDIVLQLAMNILEGKPFKRDNPLKAAIVTKDNADVLLMQTDEMNRQRSKLESLHNKVDMYFVQYNHQKVYLTLTIIILAMLIAIFFMLYREIMMKRRLEEETSNAKLTFFTNISHELRTPLTLISAPIEQLLEDKDATPSQRNLLQTMKKNVNVLLRLVNEILDFRKIQNGKMKLELSKFNLSPFLKQWVEAFANTASKNHITLESSIPEEINICADIYKLERICYNLLSNALKYTTKGGKVLVDAHILDGELNITITDTGIGIPKDKISHVFERFFQAGNTIVSGTGVGLAIVKAFAELHKGSASVESEEGKGSSFSITIPLSQPQTSDVPELDDDQYHSSHYEDSDDLPTEKASNEKASRITDSETEEQKPLALVVDDNEDVRKFIADLLLPHFDIIQAADGSEALQKAIKEVPDVIISDVMMPVMDGLELCKHIKSEIATSHIPVLLLTARILDNQRAEGYDCGADAYITKPFNGKVLIARINNLLENRRRLKLSVATGDKEDIVAENTDKKFADKFRKVVQYHLSDPELNVEFISSELGLSRVQLYRKVKALTNNSPVEIIRIARLKKAERMLATTDKTVSEISYDVGFSSPSYFAKCYKDYFGSSPNEKQVK